LVLILCCGVYKIFLSSNHIMLQCVFLPCYNHLHKKENKNSILPHSFAFTQLNRA